jgi:putative hydrolase of the HAD superfamily
MKNQFNDNIEFIYFDFDNVLAKRSIERASFFAQQLGLKNHKEFRQYYVAGFMDDEILKNQYIAIKNIDDEKLFYKTLFKKYLDNHNISVDESNLSMIVDQFINTSFNVSQITKTNLYNLSKKYQLGILTNGFPSRHLEIENSGIKDLFKVIIISSDYGCEKPLARIYEIAEDKSGVVAKNIAFVDDDEKNIVGAIKAGFGQAILFTDSFWN